MGIVQVHPRPESFCVEWNALKYNAADGIIGAKKLAKNSKWQIHVVVGEAEDPYLVFMSDAETKVVHHGDWIIRSPHGKFWFMEESEFNEQFTYIPEA